MINYWRQFAEWATELGHDLFFRTRLKLLLTYVATVSTIILLYVAARSFETERSVIVTALLFVSVAVGFFLSGVNLKPLKQAMHTQKRFIADASHELRTPLSIMKTNSEVALLEGQELNSRDAVGTIKSNLEEIDRMSNILQNLINLSQIGSPNVEIPFTKVNLADVVLHSLHSIDRIAAKKRIRLEVSKSESSMIWGNVTALEEMTLNLLKNAVLYTPEDGEVKVSVRNNTPEDVELAIRDSGIGIPAKNLPHIFEPFYKADSSRLRKAGGGSGLGLTIVSEIVKKHQGKIEIKSAVGKGTTVVVNFRVSKGLTVTRVL